MANEEWSIYGAQRLQPVAIGGKWDARESGSDKRKPLPWVATSCLSRSMVRRGSTFESVRGLFKVSVNRGLPTTPGSRSSAPVAGGSGGATYVVA
jgi:hypothetical protein